MDFIERIIYDGKDEITFWLQEETKNDLRKMFSVSKMNYNKIRNILVKMSKKEKFVGV